MRPRLRKVQEAVEQLSLLTGQLGAPAAPAVPRAVPFDLNSVIRDMVAPLQRLLGPFITLDTTLHDPSLWATGDRRHLEQVALGLVINAREALPLGGVVRITTRRWTFDQPTRFRIGTLPAGNWAVLEVLDNGAGVDDRSMRHLVERTERAVPFDSSLSLATVSSVVADAGGHLILDTPETGGTVLAACFPAVAGPRARQPATGTANAILIVEDDEWSRMSTARTLRHAGFGVLEAGHADDALELLDDVAGSCVRLMIVDAGMLTGGATPLRDRLRRDRPEIDLVITASHRASGAVADESEVLVRPFAAADLLRTIRERLLAPA